MSIDQSRSAKVMVKMKCRWKPWRRRAACLLAGLTLAGVVGCGDGRPRRVAVAGRVTIDGQPLTTGNIRFYPAANRAATAAIQPDGRFTLSTYDFGDGCVPGKHPVSVMGSKLLNPKTMRWLAPKKYADSATSGLEFDVTEATDAAEIKLTWAGNQPGKPFDETILGGGE
jgi:hypothetical protein